MGKEKYGVDAYKKVANMTSDVSSKGGDKKTVANTWGLQDLLALAMNQQGTDSRDGSGIQRPVAQQGHGSQQNRPTGHGQTAGGQYTTKSSFGTAEDVSREKKVSETKGAKGDKKEIGIIPIEPYQPTPNKVDINFYHEYPTKAVPLSKEDAAKVMSTPITPLKGAKGSTKQKGSK